MSCSTIDWCAGKQLRSILFSPQRNVSVAGKLSKVWRRCPNIRQLHAVIAVEHRERS